MVSLKIIDRVCLFILVIFLIILGIFELPYNISATENNTMQVSLERSGGFTGIPVKMMVDMATLSPSDGEQLRALVESADFFNCPIKIIDPNPKPDRFEYQITIEDGHRKHTIMVSESVMPDPLKPLIQLLMKVGRRS